MLFYFYFEEQSMYFSCIRKYIYDVTGFPQFLYKPAW